MGYANLKLKIDETYDLKIVRVINANKYLRIMSRISTKIPDDIHVYLVSNMQLKFNQSNKGTRETINVI